MAVLHPTKMIFFFVFYKIRDNVENKQNMYVQAIVSS
jgi:hypothetical protein